MEDRTTSTLASTMDPEEFSMPKIRDKTLNMCLMLGFERTENVFFLE